MALDRQGNLIQGLIQRVNDGGHSSVEARQRGQTYLHEGTAIALINKEIYVFFLTADYGECYLILESKNTGSWRWVLS